MTFTATKRTCYLTAVNQAIVSNLTPILFVPLMKLYGLTFSHLSVLVFINFFMQIVVDLVFSRTPDKYGFRVIMICSSVFALLGYVIFALSPFAFSSNVFIGIIIGTVIFSAAGGLIEMATSPLVSFIPVEEGKKAPSMAILHSFYAWGFVLTVLVTTFLIYAFPANLWYVIPLIWCVIPLTCLLLFIKAPMPKPHGGSQEERAANDKNLFKNPLMLILFAAILFGAAAEVIISQWASTFAELGLGVSKVAGDLLGPCLFALFMGIGRFTCGLFEDKIDMVKLLIVSAIVTTFLYIGAIMPFPPVVSLLCIALCGFSTSMLWPGTLTVASKYIKNGGAFMFAIMAFTGDIGAATGPMITGFLADLFSGGKFAGVADKLGITLEQFGLKVSLLIAVIYPVITTVTHLIASKKIKKLKKLKDFD